MTNISESALGIAQKVLPATMPALLLVLNLLLFGSFFVYQENPGEFLVPYASALRMYFLPGLILFVTLALFLSIVTKRAGRVINAVIILIAVMTYIHGSLLLWDVGVLDGRALEFSETWRSFADGFIWLLLGWAAIHFRHWLAEHGWKICAVLILFQSIGVFASLYNRSSEGGPNIFAFPDELAHFSDRSNVIHLVLDGFQASIFEDLITDYPQLSKDFSGFTFFRDATTSSDVTYLSIPATLSGKVFKNEQSISGYQEQTLRADNLYTVLAANNFAIDVVTPLWWNKPNTLFSSYYRIPKPYADKQEALLSTALLLADISFFRQVPHFLKAMVYRDGTWLLSGLLVAHPEQHFDHFAHAAFLADLQNRMSVQSAKPRYKFIHLVSPHAPFVSKPDCSFTKTELAYDKTAFMTQSRCTLKFIVAFLQKLKLLGIYDNSLLIIHGDHGGGVAFDMIAEDGSLTTSADVLVRSWGNPLPLILVKPPLSTGHLTISHKQVQLPDVAVTVASLLDLGNPFPGRSMFDHENGAAPVRFYYRSTMHRNDAAAKDSFDNFSSYRISGSVYKVESWSETEQFFAPVTDDEGIYIWNTVLSFGNQGTFKPFQAGGWIVTMSRDVTWTEGELARLSIMFEDTGSPVRMRAKLKPLLAPGKLDQQRVIIYFGDVKAGEWVLSQNRFHDAELIIPPALFSPDGKTEIRFELPDARSPESLRAGKDKRALAVAFMSLQFDQIDPPDAAEE